LDHAIASPLSFKQQQVLLMQQFQGEAPNKQQNQPQAQIQHQVQHIPPQNLSSQQQPLPLLTQQLQLPPPLLPQVRSLPNVHYPQYYNYQQQYWIPVNVAAPSYSYPLPMVPTMQMAAQYPYNAVSQTPPNIMYHATQNGPPVYAPRQETQAPTTMYQDPYSASSPFNIRTEYVHQESASNPKYLPPSQKCLSCGLEGSHSTDCAAQYTQCRFCYQKLNVADKNAHLEYCPAKPHVCHICGQSMQGSDLINHLKKHAVV